MSTSSLLYQSSCVRECIGQGSRRRIGDLGKCTKYVARFVMTYTSAVPLAAQMHPPIGWRCFTFCNPDIPSRRVDPDLLRRNAWMKRTLVSQQSGPSSLVDSLFRASYRQHSPRCVVRLAAEDLCGDADSSAYTKHAIRRYCSACVHCISLRCVPR